MTSKLQKAIEQGSLEAVIAALDGGADIEEPDMHGYPGLPLRVACFGGQRAIVLELLKRGANIHAVNHDGPGAPVRIALRGQHPEIVGLLIEHGADIPVGVDLPAAAENAAEAGAGSAAEKGSVHPAHPEMLPAIEYHPDSRVTEVDTADLEFETVFGNKLRKTESGGAEVYEYAWDRLKHFD